MDARRQNRKKKRVLGHLDTIKNKYYIFCEGEQTEPLYFKGFAQAIKSSPIYKNLVHIQVQGVGNNTMHVLSAAEDYVCRHELRNAQIWCVYDKDSFPAEQFNSVVQRMDKLNRKQGQVTYHAAWSNQCIEYWFILHFDWYDSDNDRQCYRKYLYNKFSQLGWKGYEKNNVELFNILTNHGQPKMAIKHAKKRLEQCEGLSPALSSPATRVPFLVEELAKYLPDELRSKYI